MKKVKLFSMAIILLSIIVMPSCKKSKVDEALVLPKNYSELTFAAIQSKDALMATSIIAASNATGVIMIAGETYCFKTNDGLYGKFEIVTIDIPSNYKLTINAVVYNADGSIKIAINNLAIRGTFTCDLDLLIEGGSVISSDFFWDRKTITDTYLVPQNGAKFYKYIF
jgi:hypothetical protein